MHNTTKVILAAIPLVVGLSGPAAAALTESADTEVQNVSPLTIDSLLNRFAGLTPGELDASDVKERIISPSKQLSTFTYAMTTMSSYYTNHGSERIVSGPRVFANDLFAMGRGMGTRDAAAPAGLFSGLHHIAPESLGEIAAGITPSSSGSSYQPTNNTVIGPTTVDPTPVPIPAAIVLLGSGLAALLPLRKRSQKTLIQVS